MSSTCENSNPLFRDGTSQQQRLIKSLLPDYVSVDERSMKDLIDFTDKFAERIQYYDANNQKNGSWKELMVGQLIDEVGQKTEPHYALFIAFLELFRYAQDAINTFSKRHLDFYYKDVLKLEKRNPVPDQVYVVFELAKNVARVSVPENTGLAAGTDSAGEEISYRTTKNLIVNKARTASFKALFYNKSNDGRLYASPVANSENGLGKEIESPEPKWRTFGNISNPAAPFSILGADRLQAEIGFALASPVLFLAEGNRTVQIILTVNTTNGLTNALLSDCFTVAFSGEEGWVHPIDSPAKLPTDTTYLGAPGSNTIIIQRTLTEDQPGIVAFNSANFEEKLDTNLPVVKVTLNTLSVSSPYIYEKLKGLEIQTARLDVNVEGVRELVLQNDNGVLDASNPFQPFGPRPKLTSSFYIGSQEVFRKRLTSLRMNIIWKGLPEGSTGFLEYYNHYIPVITNLFKRRTNNNFKVQVDILEGRNWKELLPWTSWAARLFEQEPVTYTPVVSSSGLLMNTSLISYFFGSTKLESFRQIAVTNNSTLNSYNAKIDTEIDSYTVASQAGFIRLQLQNVDFGHADYQNSYATQAINAARNGTEGNTLPNEPYTPTISELSVSYGATSTLDLQNSVVNQSEESYTNRETAYYHIEPFGFREIHPYLFNQTPIAKLVPDYSDEGALYIGIADLEVPGVLSVLFKVAEGSADPGLPVQKLKWSYLSDNEWYRLPEDRIVSDGTKGFLTSGIIVFDLPKALNTTNTILPSGYVWLKASVDKNTGAVCDLVTVQAQAQVAQFVENGTDEQHYQQALPADSITGFTNGISGIKKVMQPFASFGGRAEESDDDFYIRISERLRHKNRAVMIWDYERLILERFPNVYKVKCINHTKYISPSDIREIAPGNVSLVVVSNLRNQNAVNLLKPQTSLTLLDDIHAFISEIMPPAVSLYVKNPVYEEIQVRFNVRFNPGIDAGFYTRQLNDEIKGFLAPWAYDSIDISFGGKIEASVILNFIEERDYVDYVTCFEMDQITQNATYTAVDVAVVKSAASILTSVEQHIIHVLETDDCECDDNVVTNPDILVDCSCDERETPNPMNNGVGGSRIGQNFIVGDGTPLGE